MPLLPLAAMGSILVLLTQFDWQIHLAGAAALAFTLAAFVARQAYVRTVKRTKPRS